MVLRFAVRWLLENGEIINVGRNYLTIQYSYLVHPLVSAILSYTRNIDDRSQFIALAISYSASDEMSVGLGGQAFLGDELSEYWRYPNSLYVKAELFF
jgi:hypothetical protein